MCSLQEEPPTRTRSRRNVNSFPSPPAGVRRSVVSDMLGPHGLQPARLLCPWSSPGKHAGVRYHFLHPQGTAGAWYVFILSFRILLPSLLGTPAVPQAHGPSQKDSSPLHGPDPRHAACPPSSLQGAFPKATSETHPEGTSVHRSGPSASAGHTVPPRPLNQNLKGTPSCRTADHTQSWENGNSNWSSTRAPVPTATLLTRAETRKTPKGSTHKRMKRMCTCTVEYYSATKRMK